MKFKFVKNFIVTLALLIPSFFAKADGYLLGNGPDTAVAFNEEELIPVLKKYHIPLKIETGIVDKERHYYDVGGYELRRGVFMLQTALDNGDREDLILANEGLAKEFEEELVASTKNKQTDKFYEAPVIGIPNQKVVALAYLLPPDSSGVVKVRHYFVANPWNWKPHENE